MKITETELLEMGFNNPLLSDVHELDLSMASLNTTEISLLLKNTYLTGLKTLSLANQSITDADIEKLSQNSTFFGLFNIDLLNTKVTIDAIHTLMRSKAGTRRDLSRFNDRYEKPETHLYILTDVDIGENYRNPIGPFTITYTGYRKKWYEMFFPEQNIHSDEGIKFLTVRNFRV